MKHTQIIINSIKKLQSAGPLNLNFKIVVYCSPNWLQYKKESRDLPLFKRNC